MKPGVKSTEFWLSLLAVILGALTTAGLFDDPSMPTWAGKVVGLAISVLAALGYTASRGLVKSSELKAAAAKELAAANPK